MSNYRHICFEDLKNYFKIADYFGNLSESEKQLIRENLQVPSIKTNLSQNVIYSTYVKSTNYNSNISKEFKVVHTLNTSEPVFIVSYLDGETLTQQVIKLTN